MHSYLEFRLIDGVQRITTDLEIERGSPLHLSTAYAFVIPAIVVYGFGIPISLMIYFRKKRIELEMNNTEYHTLAIYFAGLDLRFRFW